jgi:hypothetical protein
LLKILYIPAENVQVPVSRSYFIAKGFSKQNEVYKIAWYDNRNRFWAGKPASSIYTAWCFLKSLFARFDVKKSDDYGYKVYCSVFINAFIGKIIGKYFAIQLMRNYNKRTLKKVVNKIKPDIIYHADGFYFFPALNSSIPEFSDLQDDIKWENIPLHKLMNEQDYYSNQFQSTKLNFIVSESAATSFNKHVKCNFIPFDNGADFSELQNHSAVVLAETKEKLNIPHNKVLISYIGGTHKFDENFTLKLAERCLTELPDVQFLLVGNLPKINLPNISNLGFLSVEDANKIYSISSMGITLKNTANDSFLYHSVPLKFIQYAAAKKPIVTFPIKWSEENQFKNIFHVKSEDISLWISTINQVAKQFVWDEDLDKVWSAYDWQTVANSVMKKISAVINSPSNK